MAVHAEEMKTLVIGGGWVGARFCLQDTSTCITTSRSRDKLLQLKSLGLDAVEFDLAREETWTNLPPQDLVSAVVITFALFKSHCPILEELLADHIAAGKPILCLGTTRAFLVGDHESVVNEDTPLNVASITRKYLADRIEGENCMLLKGATVFHLSGIVGDEEDSVYGKPRFVTSFVHSRNGLKLLNLIHITDICKIITLFLKGDIKAKGQRIIVSCGAFRIRDLAKGLGIDPIPEIPPPDETMKGSKIISIAKLYSLLPANYEWTLPIAGIEPVSRGLPTIKPNKYFSDGATSDRQWELVKHNFRGKWQATTVWFKKGEQDHCDFIEKLRKDPQPTHFNPGTEYHIYLLDADTAVWHGKGLHLTEGGEKVFEFGRNNKISPASSFHFEGASGQCSAEISSRLNIESNFFYERSRSMIIVSYQHDANLEMMLLNFICIAPFRCGYGHGFPLKPPQSEVKRSVNALISGLSDKTCQMQCISYESGVSCTAVEVQGMPTKSMLLFTDSSRLVQSFDDDLVCSIPTEIKPGQACDLVFGCRHTADHFKATTLTYNSGGKLELCTFEQWV